MQVRKGFTIVEVLVAVIILIIVILGLLSAVVIFEKYSMESALLNEASNILYSKLEQVKRLPYSDIIEEKLNNGADSCESALSKNFLTRSIGNKQVKFGLYYKIQTDRIYQIKEINLTVCWKYRGKLHKISGETIVRNMK